MAVVEVATIKREQRKWKAKVQDLTLSLATAKTTRSEIEGKRKALVLEAKTGNEQAKAEFEKLTEALAGATRNEQDFAEAVGQANEKLADLDRDLKAAERKAIEEQIRQLLEQRLGVDAEIEKATDALVSLIEQALKLGHTMTALGRGIGRERDLTGVKTLSRYLQWRLSEIFPLQFSRPHPAFRTPLTGMESVFLGPRQEMTAD